MENKFVISLVMSDDLPVFEDYIWITKVPETRTEAKEVLEKKIGKAVWHFYNQEFYNEEDAAREMEKRWKYHKISATEVETKRKKPRKDEPTQTVYRVKIVLAEDKSAIEKETRKRGSSSSLQTNWTVRRSAMHSWFTLSRSASCVKHWGR